MVKGGDLKSRGCEFESWRRIPNGHFSHLYYLIEKTEMNEKEAVVGTFKETVLQSWTLT